MHPPASIFSWSARLLLPALLAIFAEAQPVRSPDHFGEQVHDLRIELAPEAVAALKHDPRTYVHARVRSGDKEWPDVAIHLKGATGSFRPLGDKPGLTLDFDRFGQGQKFLGLTKVHLNNSVEDGSYLCELIGSELFRAAGIPAPDIGHAVVRLNGRRLGLYVLKEGFDRSFVEREFPGTAGTVLEAGRGQDLDGQMLAHGHRPQAPAATPADLAAAAREPDLNRRWERLSAQLDLDRFITFMAVEVMIGHRDGYALAKNNFRVFQPAGNRRAVFLPQGMDQLFQVAEVPWEPQFAGLIARAVMETPQGRQRYAERFARLRPVLLQPEPLAARIDTVSARLRAAVTWSEAAALRTETAELKERIRQRAAALERQLKRARPEIDGITALPLPASSASIDRSRPQTFAQHVIP
jgi:spore coat protein H